MKRKKPDLLIVLAIMVGLGVVITSYAQGMGDHAGASVHVSKNQGR